MFVRVHMRLVSQFIIHIFNPCWWVIVKLKPSLKQNIFPTIYRNSFSDIHFIFRLGLLHIEYIITIGYSKNITDKFSGNFYKQSLIWSIIYITNVHCWFTVPHYGILRIIVCLSCTFGSESDNSLKQLSCWH